VSADIRKIMRIAIEKNATAVVLAHNHPSGNLNPSREDDCTTHNLVEACKVMNIRMLDHLIVAGNRYYSYAEDGRL
jgi:DNA repair protein RadC